MASPTPGLPALIDDITSKARSAQQRLVKDPHLHGLIDGSGWAPRPFVGSGSIRLILIGQDPTVQRAGSRSKIKTVLNLDKPGALRQFVMRLCSGLGIDLELNVYATNFAKGIFAEPPSVLLKRTGRDLLAETSKVWLPLLHQELRAFPDAVVVSLGEPVLKVLIKPDHPQDMKYYWGWQRGWQTKGPRPFKTLEPDQSTLERRFFPFVHQPTMRGARTAFYRRRFDEYTAFIREESGL